MGVVVLRPLHGSLLLSECVLQDECTRTLSEPGASDGEDVVLQRPCGLTQRPRLKQLLPTRMLQVAEFPVSIWTMTQSCWRH